jgi:methylated-DNA-[protein]-cysteine S-methyltransferase
MASNGESLTGLWFDGQKYFASTLSQRHVEKQLPIFDRTCEWLDLYFSGKSPDFIPPVFMYVSNFRRDVYEILMTIPFGETMTYKEIADLIAKKHRIISMSAQAVGGAIAHNPISLIIPCHRVIGTNGKLTGYAGGLDKKEWLLDMEKRKI